MNHIHSKPRGTRDSLPLGSFIQMCLDNPDKNFCYVTLEMKDQVENKFKSLGFDIPANITVFNPRDKEKLKGGSFNDSKGGWFLNIVR